ncbi:hypothetical protein VKT23_011199 [Stygiomarasmius scandens]|uniref:HIT-type domain-containing protein n=1 Tax=Marasmiellus scandens TaxID=2682957 RepID=A0ABR1J9B3_9AGAR
MPLKRTRPQLSRKVNTASLLTSDVIAKRTKRHLDELERSNYAEPGLEVGEDEEESSKSFKGRARQVISDKRNLNLSGNSPAAKKKKSTMNVRTALLYRLISPQGIASMPSSIPTYLTAQTPPSSYPPRLICSVCGYWGRYKCQKCALPYCDQNCEAVHVETRCERRVL